MAGESGSFINQIYGGGQQAQSYVTVDQLGKYLDDWYAKKQGLQTSPSAPNQNVYTPVYSTSPTSAAPQQTDSTQQTPQQTAAPQQAAAPQYGYGWNPRGYMQSPFMGYGGMGGYGGYGNFYSPFGGGMSYGQMYNPFSMY